MATAAVTTATTTAALRRQTARGVSIRPESNKALAVSVSSCSDEELERILLIEKDLEHLSTSQLFDLFEENFWNADDISPAKK